MTKFIPYNRQYIDQEDIDGVVKVLQSDWLTQGPAIKQFEDSLADCCSTRFAVVFSSGTAALHASYFAAGIEAQDEIITSPITFAATANAALYLGAVPVFVDIESDTGNINPDLIGPAITDKTKAIVPIHYSGHPVNLQAIHEIATSHNLIVIEDACHALGAKYKGDQIGNCHYSDMTVFSFHPVKPIATGEGGAVLTNNETYYRKLVMFREHGISRTELQKSDEGDWYYEMQFLGYNYRMTDIQAILGTTQLKKLDSFNKKIRNIVYKYSEAFIDNPYFDIPVEREYCNSSYHLYAIRLKNLYLSKKKELFHKLRTNNIGVQVHYIPVYLHPYYALLGYQNNLCPAAEDFYRREISLPIYPMMGDGDVRAVIESLFQYFRELK